MCLRELQLFQRHHSLINFEGVFCFTCISILRKLLCKLMESKNGEDKRPLLNFNSDVAPTQESKWLNAVASLFALEFPVLAPSACAAMLLSTIPSQLNIPQIPSNWGSITLIGSGDLGKWKRGNFPKLARMFDHFCAQHGFGFHVISTFLALQNLSVQCNRDLHNDTNQMFWGRTLDVMLMSNLLCIENHTFSRASLLRNVKWELGVDEMQYKF